MKLIYLLSSIAFIIILGASATIPTTENQPIRNVPVGYDIGIVGHDSILIVKGKFVRELDGRVYIKINK